MIPGASFLVAPIRGLVGSPAYYAVYLAYLSAISL